MIVLILNHFLFHPSSTIFNVYNIELILVYIENGVLCLIEFRLNNFLDFENPKLLWFWNSSCYEMWDRMKLK